MSWTHWARALALVGSVLVAACGGGGGSPSQVDGVSDSTGTAQPGADYYPLQEGNVWFYASDTDGPGVAKVTGSRVLDGRSVVIVTTSGSLGTGEQAFAKSSTRVVGVADSAGSALDQALARTLDLALPPVAGDSRVVLDTAVADAGDLDGDGRPEAAALRAEATVVGFESVTTPAGSWSRVARVRTVLTMNTTLSSIGRAVTLTFTTDDWYAPDVGLVRSQQRASGPLGESAEQIVVQAFRVGNLRSETVAPSVVSRTPAVDDRVAVLTVRVVFSEAMAAESLGAGIVLTGPDGRVVDGTSRWEDERTLAFAPSVSLTSGRHTVSLPPGLSDRVGNTLASGSEWSFMLDREAPVIVATVPAAGAEEVALDTIVRIELDEAPDPATVTADSVRLIDSGTGAIVPATLSLSGRTLTLTPLQALTRATLYTVAVAGVRDGLGNGGTSLGFGFTTDNGRFAPAQVVPGLDALSALVPPLDTNADGRQDLVALLTGSVMTAPSTTLQVLRQQADGSLAAPIPLGLPLCSPSASWIASGDLDQDGRRDLLTASTCAIEWWRALPDGSFVLGDRITTGTAGAGDAPLVVRGTGRRGVLALPTTGTGPTFVDQPTVWWLEPDGRFGAARRVASGLRELYRSRAFDLDGDGRDDIVSWGLLSDGAFNGVAIHLQQPDGSFGPAREVAVSGACDLPRAAFDVNGDGRVDLVFDACDGNDRMPVLLQAADGGFAAGPALPATGPVFGIEVTDIDGDGRTDLVIDYRSAVDIRLRRAEGSFGEATTYVTMNQQPGFVVGDLTGDGRPDIVQGDRLLRQKAVPTGTASAKPGPAGRAALLRRAAGAEVGKPR